MHTGLNYNHLFDSAFFNAEFGFKQVRDANNDNQITEGEYSFGNANNTNLLFASLSSWRGNKHYEMVNHLGNVLTVISDKKLAKCASGTFIGYNAEVISATDYSPFGAPLSGRSFQSSEYRFGYNTQEKVDEISGSGNHTTALFWEYDTRTGRRWNRDPITFPWQSPYATNNNNPVVFTDPLGLFGSRKEAREYKKENGLKGRIQKVDDGIFAINDKKGGSSYSRDHSLDDVPNLIGRQDDGVIKSVLISPDGSVPSTGAYLEGVEEFEKRGGFNQKRKDFQKTAYENSKYIKNQLGIKIKPSTLVDNSLKMSKSLKALSKRAQLLDI